MNYQDYITYVIVDYIFMNPPKYPNYEELEKIVNQEGVEDLAGKVKFFLSSFYIQTIFYLQKRRNKWLS